MGTTSSYRRDEIIIVTGSLGKDLVINEFIFNSFLWLVLGSFGIGSVDKWINKGKSDVTEE